MPAIRGYKSTERGRDMNVIPFKFANNSLSRDLAQTVHRAKEVKAFLFGRALRE